MKLFLFVFLISQSAFAGCLNLINTSDVIQMCAGNPKGVKAVWKCDTADCICIDNFDMDACQVASVGGKSVLQVDSVKAAAKAAKLASDKANSDTLAALKAKLKDGTITDAEIPQYLKLRDAN